jgi:hypothetical protein
MRALGRRLTLLSFAALAIVGCGDSSGMGPDAPRTGGGELDPRLEGSRRCADEVPVGVYTVYELRATLAVGCDTARAVASQMSLREDGSPELSGWACQKSQSYQDGASFRCQRDEATLQFYLGG